MKYPIEERIHKNVGRLFGEEKIRCMYVGNGIIGNNVRWTGRWD